MNDKALSSTKPQLPDAEGRIADLLGGMANIQNSIQEAGGVATGLPFLSISNAGVWGFGQDRIEVETGSHWAIDIRTWKHGYIAWPDEKAKERKPLGERMVPASAPLPIITSLPNVGQPYQLQFSFELLCMSGADAGAVTCYKNGSYGAKAMVQDLVEKVRTQARVDQTKLCPVVVLDIRAYEHPAWKKTVYNPVLQIVKWISFEDFDDYAPPPLLEDAAETDFAEAEDKERARLEDARAEAAAKAARREPEVAARGTGRRPPEPKPVPRRPGQRTQPRA